MPLNSQGKKLELTNSAINKRKERDNIEPLIRNQIRAIWANIDGINSNILGESCPEKNENT